MLCIGVFKKLSVPLHPGLLCSQQDPPAGAFSNANLGSLEAVLRQAERMGRFKPDPLVSWSHEPSRKNFENYRSILSGENPFTDGRKRCTWSQLADCIFCNWNPRASAIPTFPKLFYESNKKFYRSNQVRWISVLQFWSWVDRLGNYDWPVHQ